MNLLGAGAYIPWWLWSGLGVVMVVFFLSWQVGEAHFDREQARARGDGDVPWGRGRVLVVSVWMVVLVMAWLLGLFWLVAPLTPEI